MGKIVSTAALVIGGVALIATGVGAIVGTAAVTAALGGISAAVLTAAAGVLSVGASLLNKPKQTKMNAATGDRLNVSINVNAPRIMALGSTALATDLRDQEFSGTDKEYLHRFLVNAAHRLTAVREIWFDDQLAWTSAGGVQGQYVGYLVVQAVLEGAPGNAINLGPRMGASRRFTGCGYTYLRFKLTGNSKKTESPFAQQVPTRVTIVGDGIPCYDPRQDSTQPGGSGAHRANDQSTWTWGTHARNPACQLGTWLLGWRIQNPQSLTWKLSVGRGMLPNRINWPSFIDAANLCDEAIALVAGGTEPRYRTDGLISEEDGPTAVVDAFKASMNADLDDVDGLLRLTVFHNDLATPDVDLSTSDVQDDYHWLQTPPLSESFNVVRGTYIEPDSRSLYQPAPFTEISFASPDGQDRPHKVEFGLVQSKSQAERLAKERAQRQQYGGTFQATFLARAWKAQKNSVVRFTFAPEGWTNKLFRVVETEVRQDGLVPMLLREENAAIYAWDKEEGPAVQIAEPTEYAAGDAPIPQFLGQVQDDLDELADLVAAVDDVATGKSAAFWQATPPLADASKEKDLWFDTANGNFLYRRLAGSGRLAFGGNRLTFGGNGLILAPWAPAPDQRIAQALSDAASAISQAQAAQATADEATDRLSDLDDDGKLDPFEKRSVLTPKAAQLESSWAALDAQAATFGITTERTAAASARTTWLAVLAAISPAWNNEDVTSPVDRTAYQAALDNHDAKLADLQKAISNEAGKRAQYSLVSGTKPPTDADNTAANQPSVTGTTPLIFTANYLGALDSGQAPRDVPYKRLQGSTDVTSSSTWSILSTDGVTATIGSGDGVVNITAVSKDAASFTIRSTYSGVVRDYIVAVQRSKSPPPVSTGSGGGNPGTTGSTNVSASTTSTSYGSADSGSFTCVAGTAGKVDLAASLSVSLYATGGVYSQSGAAKWQWRVPAGTYADVGTEITSNGPAVYDKFNGPEDTTLDAVATKTGLTSGTTYEFRLTYRKGSGTSGQIMSFSGTGTGVGS